MADDIDGLWRGALKSQNLDLVIRAVEASRGVHRALLALGDDGFIIGNGVGEVHDASRPGRIDCTPS